MEHTLYRKIMIASVVIGIISLVIFITGLSMGNEPAIFLPAIFLMFSICSHISLFALKLQTKSWARKITKYSIIVLPFTIAAVVLFSYSSNQLNTSSVVLLLISILLGLLYLIHLFLYTDAISVSGVLVLLSMIVVGFFFKRQHWMFSGIIITVSSSLLCIGSLMFGVRCLFLSEGISYFRNVSFFGAIALSTTIIGFCFKMQHWMGAGIFVTFGLVTQVLGTLYLLITLSSSGYIDWKPFHKKILRKILIPWIFFLFILVSRFMVPELNALIWTPEARKTERKIQTPGFGMEDYKIENKNGITEK